MWFAVILILKIIKIIWKQVGKTLAIDLNMVYNEYTV